MDELTLVKQVEFKLLLINDPAKLTQSLDLYLCPLLLKLGSPNSEVRTKVLGVLSHINSRLHDVKLPMTKLLAQLHDPALGPLIKTVAMTYISKAMPEHASRELVLDLTKSIASQTYDVAKGQFSLFLTALNSCDTVEVVPEDQDLAFMLERTTQLLLVDLKFIQRGAGPGLAPADYQFLTQNLTEAKLSAAKAKVIQWWTYLSKSLLSSKLFIPLLLAQEDRLNEVWSPARTLFKNLGLQSFELTPDIAQYLAKLCVTTGTTQAVKFDLIVRIFDVLSRADWSVISNLDLYALVHPALQSTDKRWVQSSLKLLRVAVKKGELPRARDYAEDVYNYIYTLGMSYGNANADVRSSAYETLGMLLAVTPLESLKIVTFLMQSMERDTVNMLPSIQSALNEVMKKPVPDELKSELSKQLLKLFLSSDRDGSKYASVRYMIRAFPFQNVEARLVCLQALTVTSRSDIVEEGKRGTDPYMFALEHNLDPDTLEFPDSPSMCECVEAHLTDNAGPAIAFILKCIAIEAGVHIPRDQKFNQTFWISIEHDDATYDQLKLYLQDKDLDRLFSLCLPGLLADDPDSTKVWSTLLKVAAPEALAAQSRHVPDLLAAISKAGPINVIAESIATIYDGDIQKFANELNEDLTPNKALLLSYLVKLRGANTVPTEYVIEHKLWDTLYQLTLANAVQPSTEIKQSISLGTEKAMLAYSTLSLCEPENAQEYVDKLLAVTTNSKNIDYLLANGEAISIATSGWGSQLLKMERKRGEPVDLSLHTLKHVFKDAKASPVLRRYACVRLLCLCQYNRDQLGEYTEDIQNCFLSFLSDVDEISQECASRGLGVLFEYSDKATKQSLVQRLVTLFTDDATKTLGGGRISADTELFQPGALNTGDGSVSTYKDVLNLANEVGDTSLVYKFMSLASSSQLWSTKRGAAFGLENIMARAEIGGDLVSPHSKVGQNLIPKLFRYQFDSNATVKNTMKSIWDSLIKDRQRTIADHFDRILSELLSGTTNYEWRIRQASTLALTNLIETTDWKMFKGHEQELWQIGFRMVDDIKESVRTAGFQLTKALVSVLTRRLDSQASGNSDLLAILIPFLFSTKGIHNDSEEVRSFALSALLKIALSTSKDVKPFLLDMVQEFTLLLSDLEPQAMNYIALNSANYGVESSTVDDARLQQVKRSPILETVEKIIDGLDNTQMLQVLDAWPQVVKKAVGLPSEIGASRVIVSICMRFPTDLSLSPLIKACNRQLKSRNSTVAQSYAVALAYLCRLAPIQAIQQYTKDVIQIYFDPEADEAGRLVCAHCFNALSVHASDRFLSIASLSLAFVAIGKEDGDTKVSDLFKQVWDSNTGGTGSLKLYCTDIVSLAAPHLSSTSWNLRGTCARAIGEAAPYLKSSDAELVKTLLDGLQGRTWAGKQYVFIALAQASSDIQGDLQKQAIERVINELKRNNGDYVCAILPSVGTFVAHNRDDALVKLYHARVLAAVSNDIETDEDFTDENKLEIFKGLIESYHKGDDIDDILLKLLIGWKLKEAACKGIPELAKKGYWSSVVWCKLCKLCGEDYGHEMVRLAWIEAAAAWKAHDIHADVRKILEKEQSSAVIAAAHNKEFV